MPWKGSKWKLLLILRKYFLILIKKAPEDLFSGAFYMEINNTLNLLMKKEPTEKNLLIPKNKCEKK